MSHRLITLINSGHAWHASFLMTGAMKAPSWRESAICQSCGHEDLQTGYTLMLITCRQQSVVQVGEDKILATICRP